MKKRTETSGDMAAFRGESHKTRSNTAEYHFELKAVWVDRSARSQTRSQEVALSVSATEREQNGESLSKQTQQKPFSVWFDRHPIRYIQHWPSTILGQYLQCEVVLLQMRKSRLVLIKPAPVTHSGSCGVWARHWELTCLVSLVLTLCLRPFFKVDQSCRLAEEVQEAGLFRRFVSVSSEMIMDTAAFTAVNLNNFLQQCTLITVITTATVI